MNNYWLRPLPSIAYHAMARGCYLGALFACCVSAAGAESKRDATTTSRSLTSAVKRLTVNTFAAHFTQTCLALTAKPVAPEPQQSLRLRSDGRLLSPYGESHALRQPSAFFALSLTPQSGQMAAIMDWRDGDKNGLLLRAQANATEMLAQVEHRDGAKFHSLVCRATTPHSLPQTLWQPIYPFIAFSSQTVSCIELPHRDGGKRQLAIEAAQIKVGSRLFSTQTVQEENIFVKPESLLYRAELSATLSYELELSDVGALLAVFIHDGEKTTVCR